MKLLVPILLSLVAACGGATPQMFIDGYPVAASAPTDITTDTHLGAYARTMLDLAAPGHGLVTKIEAYVPDWRTKDGKVVLYTTSSGPSSIVVLRMDGGDVRAFYMRCGIGVAPDPCFTLSPPEPQ
jgi:hypothetical protein